MLIGIVFFLISAYLLFVASVVWDAIEDHDYQGLWQDALAAPYIVFENLSIEWDKAKAEAAGQEFLSYRDYFNLYLSR